MRYSLIRLLSLFTAVLTVSAFSVPALAAEDIPFEEYGELTDITDENQLRRRAVWYYETYIADPDKLSCGINSFTVDEIMDDIRIMNGEFMRDAQGRAVWNETCVIAAANDLHRIANYDSFAQYGTQIFFTPTAPLFTDGSAAQKDALALDRAMEEVVAAIRAEDDESFVTAAMEWGNTVVDIFDRLDDTGEYAGVYQVGAAQGFALYHAMSSKYASTILEYSEARHLDVSIPASADRGTGETQGERLDQIICRLNEAPVDAAALRTGHIQEYAEQNLSLPQDLCLRAKDYFGSRYFREQHEDAFFTGDH